MEYPPFGAMLDRIWVFPIEKHENRDLWELTAGGGTLLNRQREASVINLFLLQTQQALLATAFK